MLLALRWLPCFLLAAAACRNGSVAGPIDGEIVLQHVRTMVAHGPRPAGSEALAKTRAYIVDRLKAAGLKPALDTFRDEKRAPGITFQNISVEIPGTRKGEDRLLVLGGHYDTKRCSGHPRPEQNFRFVGANDGGSSAALLIELAIHLKKHPLPCPVLVVWFDGEESLDFDWNEDRALFGSKRCVKRLRARYPKERDLRDCVPVMILLDMVGAKDLSISKDTNSDRRLIEIVGKTAKELGAARYFFHDEVEVTDDHIPFRDYGIAVLDLIQFGDFERGTPSWWHTKDDDLPILSAKSLAIVGNVVAAALPKIAAAYYR